MTFLTLSWVLLSAAPPPAPPQANERPAPQSEVVRQLVKEAIAQPVVPGERPLSPDAGPDVAKLPFTPDAIKQVVQWHQPQIQDCYEETLAAQGTKKAVEGIVKTSFVISADGLVTRAQVDKKASTLKNEKLHDCVVTVLSTMVFPKPPDGQEQPISFPFNLKAVH